MQLTKYSLRSPVDPNELKNIYPTNSIEVNLFANTLTVLCLEHSLDVSYTKCFSYKL